MTYVEIPFLPVWEPAMLDGTKTHTCRSKRYGAPGDRFQTFGATFELVTVRKVRLDLVRDSYWREEGCRSPEHFVEVWAGLHPGRGFVPTDQRWLHEFKLVPDGCENRSTRTPRG